MFTRLSTITQSSGTASVEEPGPSSPLGPCQDSEVEASAAANPETWQPWTAPVPWALAGCALILTAFSLIAERPGTLPSLAGLLGLSALLIAPLAVIPLLWHQKGSADRRDAALTIVWGLLLILLFKQAILTATAWRFPLRDALFQSWDARFGLRVPAILGWAAHHRLIGHMLEISYGLLPKMMISAFLLPALLGRRLAAERFVLANALGFVFAVPFFLWFPAIGPWVGWHVPASSAQHACEVALQGVRAGALTDGFSVAASVCLPSFHVFWAVTSAQALWTFRWLRIPAAVVAALIVVSTLTTGWHYGIDVLAGLVFASLCAILAGALARRRNRSGTSRSSASPASSTALSPDSLAAAAAGTDPGSI